MTNTRTGPFWDAVEGRVDPPPAAKTLGWKLEAIDPQQGTVRVGFEARDEFLNPVGAIQGGFLAAMLDDTLGPALAGTLEPDQFAPTLELKVNFLNPASPGRLTGSGRVVHRGATIAFLEGSLTDDAGRVIATATATAKIIRLKPDAQAINRNSVPDSPNA